jgi:hypothetical protein
MGRTTSLANCEAKRACKAHNAAKKAAAKAAENATSKTATDSATPASSSNTASSGTASGIAGTDKPPAKRACGAQQSFEVNKAIWTDSKLVKWTTLHNNVQQGLPGSKTAMSLFYDNILSEYLVLYGRTYTNSMITYADSFDNEYVQNKIREVCPGILLSLPH